ncbi:MAG: peptidase T [Firmicutes bacterium]|nr:peptidase T [Bacillota bacterium]
MTTDLKSRLEKRFYRYSEIPSQSDPSNPVIPSSQGQWEMAELLREELEALGFVDVTVDQHGIVYGHMPARLAPGHGPVPAVGWCCHMDTVAVGLSPEVHPITVHNYQGGDILQNEEKQLFIRVDEHPELLGYVGQDIIVSDGTSVLGADNKAALANFMTAMEILAEDPGREHGDIYVAFTPDEETGLRGSKLIDFSKFPVDFAYTIDCCEQGEVVYETFNAGEAVLNVRGVSAHPMSAKNVLVNACTVMRDYAALLDQAEVPEHTEIREGYLWVSEIYSDGVTGKVIIDIRDHDRAKYEYRKTILKEALEIVKLRYPKAEITLDLKDVYGNILDAMTEENRQCVDLLLTALKQVGIEPKIKAMRGGTDGSFISTKGIPTPNYFTGALNFHSSAEFLPMDAFENALRVTLKLIELIAAR